MGVIYPLPVGRPGEVLGRQHVALPEGRVIRDVPDIAGGERGDRLRAGHTRDGGQMAAMWRGGGGGGRARWRCSSWSTSWSTSTSSSSIEFERSEGAEGLYLVERDVGLDRQRREAAGGLDEHCLDRRLHLRALRTPVPAGRDAICAFRARWMRAMRSEMVTPPGSKRCISAGWRCHCVPFGKGLLQGSALNYDWTMRAPQPKRLSMRPAELARRHRAQRTVSVRPPPPAAPAAPAGGRP